MATLAELKQSLADEEEALEGIKADITELDAEVAEHRTEHASSSTDKLAKIEAAIPVQRAVDQVANKLWEIEQAIQSKLGQKMDKAAAQTASEARITKLKADIKKAGG